MTDEEALRAAMALDAASVPPPPQPPTQDELRAKWVAEQAAKKEPPSPHKPTLPNSVKQEDFYAYLPKHEYIFTPTGDLWPAASVDKRLLQIYGGKPSEWLDLNRSVEQMTWAPGMPMIIQHRLVSGGDWIYRDGCNTFNLYKPPKTPKYSRVEVEQVEPWLALLRKVYPEHVEHLVRWFAHRVQRPGEKLNHALVLGGKPGIGKDSLLDPVRFGIGPWNFAEVSPTQMMGRFNGFLRSVILRVSEARDQGDSGGSRIDRYGFYEHMKTYTAAPPNTLLCDEKNLRAYPIMNVCGVIITTNHRTDGIYLPADDRRHYVAWSERDRTDFAEDYWRDLYDWYERCGRELVAAYLDALDLSEFDPKAPPLKTPDFWAIVDANRPAEDSELADALDALGRPLAVTITQLKASGAWPMLTGSPRKIPHRFEAAGYVPVRNDAAEDGLWKVAGKRQAIYAHATLTLRDRFKAAAALCATAVPRATPPPPPVPPSPPGSVS
jgi:uncharacterized protein DUF5906